MNIICNGRSAEIPSGTTVMECLRTLKADLSGVLAVRQGGRVLEMNDPILREGEIFPLTLQDEEGRRIYERGLRFVLLLAIRRLMPGQRVRIEYSVSGGVFLCTPGREITEADCEAIRQEMEAITAADMPFRRRKWALPEAIAYFEQDGQPDKVELLRRRTVPFFNMYECGGMWDYFYGAMPPSTGHVRVFGVRHMPGRGMALLTADAKAPHRPRAYIHRPKHLRVFDQSGAWCAILGVQNAPDLDRMMDEKQLRGFIRVNEALQARAIDEMAETIVERGRRIVMIAGPSSSGKTTTTGRLAIALRVLGCRPALISLDDYYIDRHLLPLEPDGTVDLESIHTIDVALFRQHMIALLAGETVEIPRYSFATGCRMEKGVPTRLDPGQPVLVEGIHGLNPALVEGVPQEAIHRIFVSALTCINLDDHNRIRTTDVRLLRRIVRDNQFRSTLPEETLAMWPSVRRGEEKWIFPYQENADSMFNTALHYELPFLKTYAYDLLRAIPPESPHYLAARRLVKMLGYFTAAPEDVMDEVPPLSLLREFVGGCTIDKV